MGLFAALGWRPRGDRGLAKGVLAYGYPIQELNDMAEQAVPKRKASWEAASPEPKRKHHDERKKAAKKHHNEIMQKLQRTNDTISGSEPGREQGSKARPESLGPGSMQAEGTFDALPTVPSASQPSIALSLDHSTGLQQAVDLGSFQRQAAPSDASILQVAVDLARTCSSSITAAPGYNSDHDPASSCRPQHSTAFMETSRQNLTDNPREANRPAHDQQSLVGSVAMEDMDPDSGLPGSTTRHHGIQHQSRGPSSPGKDRNEVHHGLPPQLNCAREYEHTHTWFGKDTESEHKAPPCTPPSQMHDQFQTQGSTIQDPTGPTSSTTGISNTPPATQPRTGTVGFSPKVLARTTTWIAAQFSRAMMDKHDELRRIDQEIAKCQVALEQLRRCRQIQWPAHTGRVRDMIDVANGVGAVLQPPPWGVADGPYTHHYSSWLVPLHGFTTSQALSHFQTSHSVDEVVGERRTRTSQGQREPIPTSFRSRSGRGSAKPVLQSLPLGYPEPKAPAKPNVLKRKSDGMWVRLVCPDCKREDFNNTQGFLNHCRIQHHIEYATHQDAAIRAGSTDGIDQETGQTIETFSAGSPSASQQQPVNVTSPTTAQGHRSSIASTHYRSVGVHPYNRADVIPEVSFAAHGSTHAHPLAASSFRTQRERERRRSRRQSDMGPPPSPAFIPSSRTPHLSERFARTGRAADLESLVKAATTKEDIEGAVMPSLPGEVPTLVQEQDLRSLTLDHAHPTAPGTTSPQSYPADHEMQGTLATPSSLSTAMAPSRSQKGPTRVTFAPLREPLQETHSPLHMASPEQLSRSSSPPAHVIFAGNTEEDAMEMEDLVTRLPTDAALPAHLHQSPSREGMEDVVMQEPGHLSSISNTQATTSIQAAAAASAEDYSVTATTLSCSAVSPEAHSFSSALAQSALSTSQPINVNANTATHAPSDNHPAVLHSDNNQAPSLVSDDGHSEVDDDEHERRAGHVSPTGNDPRAHIGYDVASEVHIPCDGGAGNVGSSNGLSIEEKMKTWRATGTEREN